LRGSLVACAVVAAAIVLYVLINHFGGQSIRTPLLSIPRLTGVPRYETVGNVSVLTPEFATRASANLKQAWALFLSQQDGLIWNALPGYGVLFWFSPPLAILGLGVLIGKNA